MIGIECDFKGTIEQFFEKIPLDIYDWYIFEDEIIFDNNNFHPPVCMDGNSLKKNLLHQDNMIVFINLQAYPKGVKPVKIRTYKDFIDCPCQFILLVSDRTYWEVYAKDQMILKQINANIKYFGCIDFSIKTIETDCRTVMSVI